MNALQFGRHAPKGLEPAFFQALNGTAEQAAEKLVAPQKAHLGR